jgi:hypothetical protein
MNIRQKFVIYIPKYDLRLIIAQFIPHNEHFIFII